MLAHQPEVTRLIHRERVQQLEDDAQQPIGNGLVAFAQLALPARTHTARGMRSHWLGAAPSRRRQLRS